MPRYFTDELLRRLRNEISFRQLWTCLKWPHKRRGDDWAFVCPSCGEIDSKLNPRTNLARCFHCQTNFNPIEFTMSARRCDFVPAVHYLQPLLRARQTVPADRPTL